MKNLFLVPLVILLVIGFILTGCSGTSSPTTTTAPTTSAITSTSAPTTSTAPITSPAALKLPSTISIAGGSSGSAVFAVSTGEASIISKYTSMNCTSRPYPATAQNVAEMTAKRAEFMSTSVQDAWTVYNGTFDFAALGKTNIRLVKLGWDATITGLEVRKDLNITKVSQVKGIRIALPKANPSVNICVDAELMGAGLTRDDVKIVDVASLADMGQAVKEGRADACHLATSASALPDLNSVIPMRFLDLKATSPENEKKMFDYAPILHYYSAKAGQYTAVVEDTTVVAQDQGLLCMDFASDDIVYAVTKVLYEQYNELAAIHPQLKASYKPEMSVRNTFPIPFHPGAIKFYKEVGIWTPEMDKVQQQLLAGH